jgi:membrane protein implicated in regulation of membrane protease activity
MSLTLAHLLLLAAVVILEGGTLIAWGRAGAGTVAAVAQYLGDQPPAIVVLCGLAALVLLYRAGRAARRHGG